MMKILNVLMLFFAGFVFSQNSDSHNFDERISKSDYYFKNFKDLKALELALGAYNIAKKDNNKENLSKSCLAVANITNVLSLYNETLNYLSEGLLACPEDNVRLKIKFLNLESTTFLRLGLLDKAKDISNQVEELTNGQVTKSKEDLIEMAVNYQSKATYYSYLKDRKSQDYYNSMTEDIIKRLSDKDFANSPLYICYYNFGQDYLDRSDYKNALFYFKKFDEICRVYKKKTLYIAYYGLADYYLITEQNPKKALGYYLQSLYLMEKNKIVDSESIEGYNKISIIYGMQGDKRNEKYYRMQYLELEKSEKDAKNKAMNKALKMIVEFEKNKNEKIRNRWITILVTSFLVITLLVYLFAKKMYSKIDKEKNLHEQVIQDLELKVNEAYKEVVDLAKKNDPLFWAKFQNVYPNFREKLLKINPTLKNSEFILCAYLYLGFSSKEISEYTFKSTRTIENNRYNIRKRLGFSKNENLTALLRNYVEQE